MLAMLGGVQRRRRRRCKTMPHNERMQWKCDRNAWKFPKDFSMSKMKSSNYNKLWIIINLFVPIKKYACINYCIFTYENDICYSDIMCSRQTPSFAALFLVFFFSFLRVFSPGRKRKAAEGPTRLRRAAGPSNETDGSRRKGQTRRDTGATMAGVRSDLELNLRLMEI